MVHKEIQTIIVGAGPAGLTAGAEISKAGAKVHVLEASSAVGGLARTIELWGRKVDIGPHRFFTRDRRINQAWLDAVGDRYQMIDRLTRIRYRNEFFQYPLEPLDAFRKLGPVESLRCVASFMRAQLVPPNPDGSFETWVVRAFGRRLFKLFFKSYSEKLWGAPCTEIDSDFAAQRIKRLDLREALLSGIVKSRRRSHQTLTDRFAYPINGSGYPYEQMASRIEENGGAVSLRRPVKRIIVHRNRVQGLELSDGAVLPCRDLISTMPLTLLIQGLEQAPADVKHAANSLQFRNTILVYLLLDSDTLFPDNWVYIQVGYPLDSGNPKM